MMQGITQKFGRFSANAKEYAKQVKAAKPEQIKSYANNVVQATNDEIDALLVPTDACDSCKGCRERCAGFKERFRVHFERFL